MLNKIIKIYHFLFLFLGLIFLFLLYKIFFGATIFIPFLYTNLTYFFVIIISFLLSFFLVYKNLTQKYRKTFQLYQFGILGFCIFFVGILNHIEYIYPILIFIYIFLVFFIVYGNFVTKFWFIPILILLAKIFIILDFLPISSKKCNKKIKGFYISSCNCKGLKHELIFETRCFGERTDCYKFKKEEKIKVNCEELDNL